MSPRRLVALIGAAGRCSPPWRRMPPTRARWVETGHSPVPVEYFQGVTTDRAATSSTGSRSVYRTDPLLNETARLESGSRPTSSPARGLQPHRGHHLGQARGGRVLLPLECFLPFFGNTCKTGSIGVADPETLAWRYYVLAEGIHRQGDVGRGVTERAAAVDA